VFADAGGGREEAELEQQADGLGVPDERRRAPLAGEHADTAGDAVRPGRVDLVEERPLGSDVSGAVWVASYVALSVVVLGLVIATLALYRQVDPTRPASVRTRWPLARLVGEPLEPAPWSLPHTGFVLLTTSEYDSFASVISLAVVAEDWHQPLSVVVRRGGGAAWLDRLNGHGGRHHG
jgi:hypothetical protein